MAQEEGEERLVTTADLPDVFQTFLALCRDSLQITSNSSKSVEQLDPLVWSAGFQQTFSIDPPTLHEMTQRKQHSSGKPAFQRELDPELFHWAGTTITFMNLHLLRGFWNDQDQAKANKPKVIGA